VTKKVVTGWVLTLLGAFLLITALLLRFWAPAHAERTPLDTSNDTFLTGQADKLNPATGKLEHNPVWVVSRTRTDSKKSDDKVIVFVNTTCVNVDDGPDSHQCLKEDDPRMISDSIDVFAADRHTGQAVNDKKYIGADGVAHEGLVNKFPFDTQKKDYQYWDGTLGAAATAKYEGEVEINGLKTYKFQFTVPPSKIQVAEGIEGTYEIDKQMWVEPRTGAIVDQAQHEVRKLTDGSTILDLSLRFTDETKSQGVTDAKSNLKTLDLTFVWVPLIGLVGGLICLVVAGFLLLSGRRPEAPAVEQREPAHV
jgi:hypothetical protein